jgi:hypothetical protein
MIIYTKKILSIQLLHSDDKSLSYYEKIVVSDLTTQLG